MKTMKYLTIGLLFIGMTALVGCKKENQINKNLYKKGGEWNIESYKTEYSYASQGNVLNSETLLNCGKFTFNESGSGTVSLIYDGTTETSAFTYSNTEDKLTLIIDGFTQEYDLDWEKDNITISYSKTNTNPDNTFDFDSETWKLKKK